jgi:hypothetical protein
MQLLSRCDEVAAVDWRKKASQADEGRTFEHQRQISYLSKGYLECSFLVVFSGRSSKNTKRTASRNRDKHVVSQVAVVVGEQQLAS